MKNIPALAEGATNSEKVIHIIATAYATEDKSVIDRIESILLPDDISLNDELTEMLNSTGNNPIEEPELYKILEARDYDEFKKLCIKNRDIDSIDTYDLQDLSVAISKKITSLTDDRGAFKSTENTKELKLPKSSELIELNRIITT
ncbi:MAG: hypothetical protein JJV88_00305, partial [Sulfurovum sp.]|nr:hypothetical protein [Sulfurovaceae bacterium]